MENLSSVSATPGPFWNDWRWQMKNRITDAAGLATYISLTSQQAEEIDQCLRQFRMAVTPYYASLMDPVNQSCPIRRQAVPATAETHLAPYELRDPLAEENSSPVPNLVHRYPDRVLLLATHMCSMYCRHCTRRRLVGQEDRAITLAELERVVAYIEANSQIRDVLISGGDPLCMGDAIVERIVARIRRIAHVQVIRIGTRVPVVMPMRITSNLLSMLKKYQPIWINTHFNHPRELTDKARAACAAIVDAGIPLGNQSVLLKGINDDAETMKQLLLSLVQARVRPYYLYQCDLSQGLSHFRTPVSKGVEIIQALTGNISGYAIPKFVIDAPGGGGKIPIGPEYVVAVEPDRLVLKNYAGDLFYYPNI